MDERKDKQADGQEDQVIDIQILQKIYRNVNNYFHLGLSNIPKLLLIFPSFFKSNPKLKFWNVDGRFQTFGMVLDLKKNVHMWRKNWFS